MLYSYARWMVKAFKDLQTTKETVKLGWRKSGLRTQNMSLHFDNIYTS